MVKAVNINELKENVKHFFSQPNEILVTGSDKVGEFSVNQVKISAQISKICLLGSGTKMSVNGGVKFILTRKN
ncbi:MAG: Pepco domain-containing protein [Thermodesulfobacteriota bacterium]